jgi:ribosomal protein S18 acetylase RimI-like enzyme
MALAYFKRYRMEISLLGRDFTRPMPLEGYTIEAWENSLLETHAEVKYASFRDEIDANVFPCFTELAGCYRLMSEIVRKPGFLPQATWLAVYRGGDGQFTDPCGTVQGLRDPTTGLGAIQNLGIVPEHRNRGLGTALMVRALRGFRQVGLTRAFLEVTAENHGAIRLYERMGFTVVKTVFKTSEVACS